jgi:hypothetical protein
MYSDASNDDRHDDQMPDAHTCPAGSQSPFGLDEDCPDCRAPADIECAWSCSSNWN